jgi:hypothetical protein
MIDLIKKGSTGDLVAQWQDFLSGQGFQINFSGIFDDETEAATKLFQEKSALGAFGIAGKKTFGAAAALGFEWVDNGVTETGFPQKPDFFAINDVKKQELFGPLEFIAAPTASNPEGLKITNDWEEKNLQRVIIPQLIGVKGASAVGAVSFHKKAADQFAALWQAWEEAELLDRVISYAGAYMARFVRGLAKQEILSNHAFATAFDINSLENPLGAEPAKLGTKGSVYELVPLAHEYGFYWGGHFKRKDGMHFEVAKIIEFDSITHEISKKPLEIITSTTNNETEKNSITTPIITKLAEIHAATAAIESEAISITPIIVTKLGEIRSAAAAIEVLLNNFTLLPPGDTPKNTTTNLPEGRTLYRVLPDTKVARWNHNPRTLAKTGKLIFPETSQVVPLTRDRKSVEATGFTTLDDRWKDLFKKLNSKGKDISLNKKRFDFVTANDTAWFNHAPLDRSSGWNDGMESLAMGSAPGLWDNVLACREAGGDWLEVLTLRPEDSTEGISREETPLVRPSFHIGRLQEKGE